MTAPTPRTPIDDHPWYNTRNYPIFVGTECRNWDTYANENGNLASIAVEPGCLSSHYGSPDYLRRMVSRFPEWDWQFTLAGLRLLGRGNCRRLVRDSRR